MRRGGGEEGKEKEECRRRHQLIIVCPSFRINPLIIIIINVKNLFFFTNIFIKAPLHSGALEAVTRFCSLQTHSSILLIV